MIIKHLMAALAVLAMATAAQVSPAFAGGHGLIGSFTGASGHAMSGRVEIVKDGAGYKVILLDDFSLDGAPDPKLGFGNGNDFDDDTLFAKLKNLTGKQEYAVPADVDPSAYDTFYVWCEKFAVPLGLAKYK